MFRKQAYLVCMFVFLLIGSSVKAQVTIGVEQDPMVVSVLELISDVEGSGKYGGLRLPQLTSDNIGDLSQNILAGGLEVQAKGLMVYNTTSDCTEVWNGAEFKSLCGDIGQATFDIDCSKMEVFPHDGTGIPIEYKQNSAIIGSTHYIKLPVVATKKGTYNISVTTGNGYSFTANGLFDDVGDYSLILEGRGTPIEGDDNPVHLDDLTIRLNNTPVTSCAPTVQIPVAPASNFAEFTYDCDNSAIRGQAVIKKALDNTNYIDLVVNVDVLGAFSFVAESNGMRFVRNGEFTTTGTQTVKLLGSGTPLVSGTYALNIKGQLPAGATLECQKQITVAFRSVKMVGFGSSTWAPHQTGTRQASAIVRSTANFGTLASSTVKVHGIQLSNTGSSSTMIGELATTDIVVLGYGDDPSSTLVTNLVDFVKNKKGVVIAAIGEYDTDAQNLINGIFGTSISITTGASTSGYPIPNTNDPMLVGPFGDIRGNLIGPDGGDGRRMTRANFDALGSDAVLLAGDDSYVYALRHKDLGFIIALDGGSWSGTSVSFVNSGVPVVSNNFANSILYANAIAWAIEYVQNK